MSRSLFTLALLTTLTSLTSSAEAASAGSYSMQVYMDGRPATEYHARGKTYIEARKGREYIIKLTNNSDQRVAVALSVDGLNSIDAKHTSAKEATKWVVAPWSTLEVKGWQTSSSNSRAFYFTNEQGSYGAWLGDTTNLGVISAAWFPEVVPVVYYDAPVLMREESRDRADLDRYGAAQNEASGGRGGASTGASAPAASSGAVADRKSESAAKSQAAPADELAATGIGRQQRSEVSWVDMEISENAVAVTSIRYEYRDELVKLGVLPRPKPTELQRREQSSGFAPDPYSQGW